MYGQAVEEFRKPIIVNGTRVLRPKEWEALLVGCSKIDYKTMLEALLYTGMRYVEMQRFQEQPGLFDGNFINLPQEIDRKKERRQRGRWIRLNNQGKMAVRHFLSLKRKLPSYQSWNENLKCWCKRASLNPQGVTCKTTRKTLESWLMFYYPTQIALITLSQGHTTLTSMQHYVNMPFTESDRIEIRNYVEGWVTNP